MSILRVKDANSNIIEIPAIKGDKGDAYILTDNDKKEIANRVSVPIDQTYSPESENAQSGKAVAEAVAENWEKITDITLEENAVVSITEDMDGNPLNLKKLKVLVELPSVTEATSVDLRLNNIFAIATQNSTATAQKPSYSISAEYTFDWQFLTCVNSSNLYTNSAPYTTPYGHRYSGRDIPFPCTSIALAHNTAFTKELPIGATVKIWGVRA